MEHLSEKMKKDIQRGLILRYMTHLQMEQWKKVSVHLLICVESVFFTAKRTDRGTLPSFKIKDVTPKTECETCSCSFSICLSFSLLQQE